MNRFGFFEQEPFTKRGDDRFVILILGGSFADQVFYLGKETMAARLRNYDAFGDKKIEIVSVALGGYKQPQQMIILADLLLHGAQYDAVVNIDGFNEVDASLDNYEDGLNPFYPNNWKLHARQGIDTASIAQVGRIENLREKRRTLRQLFARAPLRSLTFTLTLWDVLDQRYLGDMRREMSALDAQLTSDTLPPRIRGPAVEYPDAESVYREIALVWARASELAVLRLSEAGHGVSRHHAVVRDVVAGEHSERGEAGGAAGAEAGEDQAKHRPGRVGLCDVGGDRWCLGVESAGRWIDEVASLGDRHRDDAGSREGELAENGRTVHRGQKVGHHTGHTRRRGLCRLLDYS
jgi:hypothetical protein